MAINPDLIQLAGRLLTEDSKALEAALLEAAELLDLRSRSLQTGIPSVLADQEARSFLSSRLRECIDRDPVRPMAATAIWVLGKLYDKSLESYLVTLALNFLDKDHLSSHLHQTIIALDNLGLFSEQEFMRSQSGLSAMRKLMIDYINKGDPGFAPGRQ